MINTQIQSPAITNARHEMDRARWTTVWRGCWFVRRHRRMISGGPLVSGMLLGALMLGNLGCSGTDTTGQPPLYTTNPYTTLRLNVRAAVMAIVAPYDTLQLIPTAYDANGVAIPLPGPVKYTANDTSLRVSATGLVTLKNTTGPNSYVIASVQDTTLKLTHVDTAFILGKATVPTAPLATFSIQPLSGDSAVIDVRFTYSPSITSVTKTPTVTALDAQGHVIPTTSLLTHFTSSSVYNASVNAKTGAVTAQNPGTTVLTATTTYYGVTKTDTLLFRIGYPDISVLTVSATSRVAGTYMYFWNGSNVVTGVNKSVIFVVPDCYAAFSTGNIALLAGVNGPVGDRLLNEGMSVVFDDPTAAHASLLSNALLITLYSSNGTGNVSLQIPDSVNIVDSVATASNGVQTQYSKKLAAYCRSTPFSGATARSFATPGTYHFTSPTTGASGTITVVAP